MSERNRPRRSLWMFGLDRRSRATSSESRPRRLSSGLGVELVAPRIPPRRPRVATPRISPPEGLSGFCRASKRDRAYHSYGNERLHGPLGRYPNPPDVVAHPRNEAELEAVLEWCAGGGYCTIPYGGGSSVVGGVTPPAETGRS